MCGAGEFLLVTDSGEAVTVSESLAHAFQNVPRIYRSFGGQDARVQNWRVDSRPHS